MSTLHRDEIIDLIPPSSKNSADRDIEFAYLVLEAATKRAQRVPMTDADVMAAFKKHQADPELPFAFDTRDFLSGVQAAEAHHGIGEQP